MSGKKVSRHNETSKKIDKQDGQYKSTDVQQILRSVRRISGPVSYHIFQYAINLNTIFLFGDVHFSHNNQCIECHRDKSCFHIVDAVKYFEEDAHRRNTTFDVLMEFPFVSGKGPDRDQFLAKLDQHFIKNSKSSAASRMLLRLFGKSTQYIGIFSSLYKHFAHRFYYHPPGHNQIRFHYADARFEYNVRRFFSPVSVKWIYMFHNSIKSITQFRRLLEVFLIGYRSRRSFQDQISEIFGPDHPPLNQSLSSKRPGGPKTLHKIAKQVYKLPPDLRAKVEAFISDKLDNICAILSEDIQYEDGIRLLNIKHASRDRAGLQDGTLAYIRAYRLKHYMAFFSIFMELITQTVMMDVYLLARLLFNASRPESAHGVTLVYAGDYHISVYADFFNRYLNMQPLGCHVSSFSPRLSSKDIQKMVQRCVVMNLGICNMSHRRQKPVP